MAVRRITSGWQVDWRDEYERRRYRTFLSKDAAKDFLIKERARVLAAKHGDRPKRVTFKDFATNWLAKVKAECESRNKPDTYRWYESSLRVHLIPYFGDTYLADITRQVLQGSYDKPGLKEYLQNKGLKSKTARNQIMTLGTLLNDAYKKGLTEKNLKDYLEKPKVITETENKRPFSQEEVGLFFQHCPRDYHLYFAISFFAGMRTGEVMALRFGDIDLHNQKIHVERSLTRGNFSTPKTGRGRIIDITPHLAPFFTSWRHLKDRRSDLIFPGYDKGNVRARVWIPTLRKMRVAYRKPYSTRHTFASMMLSEGQPPAWVAQMMGDRLETVLRHYHQWIPTEYKTELMRPIGGFNGGYLAVATGTKKQGKQSSSKSDTYWVSGGDRTHDFQDHNLAL